MPLTSTVFGLGLMGRPMARTLVAAGFEVRGWNRSPLSEELTRGIPLAANLDEAARAEVCLLMLSDSNAVDAVLAQIEPQLRAGQIVLDMSSSEPARSKINAQRLSEKNIGWVDAPVSGGPEGAAAHTLAIMAGATENDFARVKPLLDAMGGNVVRVGEPGSGHAVKAINQLIVGITTEAVAEALTLAEKLGIDPRNVQAALKGGFADSKILQIHGTRMINRAYVPGGRVRSHLKDLHIAQALAKSVNVRLPHLENTIAIYERLMAQGDGELDHSAPHKLFWMSDF